MKVTVDSSQVTRRVKLWHNNFFFNNNNNRRITKTIYNRAPASAVCNNKWVALVRSSCIKCHNALQGDYRCCCYCGCLFSSSHWTSKYSFPFFLIVSILSKIYFYIYIEPVNVYFINNILVERNNIEIGSNNYNYQIFQPKQTTKHQVFQYTITNKGWETWIPGGAYWTPSGWPASTAAPYVPTTSAPPSGEKPECKACGMNRIK